MGLPVLLVDVRQLRGQVLVLRGQVLVLRGEVCQLLILQLDCCLQGLFLGLQNPRLLVQLPSSI